MFVSFGSLFVALLFGVLIASAFWFLVAAILGKGKAEERGTPAKPACVLHLHKHTAQQVWHRGQVFHDHEHSGGFDGGGEEDEFVPTPANVEQACNEQLEEERYTTRRSESAAERAERVNNWASMLNGVPLPAMRLASDTESHQSAKLPEPSANVYVKKSYFDKSGHKFLEEVEAKPQACNVERHELARNTDPAQFPSEALTRAADQADMALRPGREVCLAEQSGEQRFPGKPQLRGV